MVFFEIVAAVLVVSAASLVGVPFFLGRKPSERHFFLLVSFAAGTLLGAAFLDLLPEAMAAGGVQPALVAALAGLLVFFILEKVVLWHHHHGHGHAGEKPIGYLSLVGDALHNFFDGTAIAAAFLVSPPLGVATTIAVLLHEIPQELGDFSLLIYSGFSARQAILFNLLSALTALVGALVFYFAAGFLQGFEALGLAFTAGMFIYIATVDLVPELHKERDSTRSLQQFSLIVAGIAAIGLVSRLLGV